jgi:outer membrane protein OmpA-like peptidoglycan-associated protein
MRQVAREDVILFQYARSDIDPKSFATLNKVAEAANRCPEFRIEVEGHTDSDGAPDRNQRLSERRATAVREYLVKAGVNADRVKAIGYGETRPEAPNDTAENKARNRRIEFSVATE